MGLQVTLEQILSDASSIRSEIVLILGSVLVLLSGLFKISEIWTRIFYGSLLTVAWVLLEPVTGDFFFGQWTVDGMSLLVKHLTLFTGLMLLLYKKDKKRESEYYFLILAVIAGSMLMVSSTHFLLLYLALEITSYASYFLTGIDFDKRGLEGTIKYYLFGAVSSAVLLFGISLFYGATGELVFAGTTTEIGSIGLLLILVGLLFKTSVVPFHLWVPSTYQVAPTQVVALFSIVPKLAGFGVIFHLMQRVSSPMAENVLLSMALLSVVWGTLAALNQTNTKRLLAYGAIAHSGFLLPLVIVQQPSLPYAFGFYASVYTLMNLSVFYLVQLHENGRELNLSDFDGLGKVYPYIGASFVIALISLTGLPPTGGFSAKLILFSTIWEEYGLTGNVLWLAFFVVGILSSAISLFYYLRIPYHYFFREGDDHSTRIFHAHGVIATFLALALLWIFIQPNILDNFVSILRLSENYIP